MIWVPIILIFKHTRVPQPIRFIAEFYAAVICLMVKSLCVWKPAFLKSSHKLHYDNYHTIIWLHSHADNNFNLFIIKSYLLLRSTSDPAWENRAYMHMKYDHFLNFEVS